MVNDPDMPATDADLTRIVVNHTKTHLVVRATLELAYYNDYVDFWIDTPRHTRNYYARIRPETEYGDVLRVRGFRTKGKSGCHDWDARFLTGNNVTVTAKIPRSCWGNSKKVRVSVRATIVGASAMWRDWAPISRSWSRWVAAG